MRSSILRPHDGDDERGRYATKRDRLARLTRLVAILQAHPEGMRTADIAERVDMSVRTVYRDLNAIEGELHLPVWSDDGVWGIDSAKAFLPPLKLTQQEAMAVVLSARLMVRYADKYDPDLAAAFEKLERGLPPPLAEHVERTLDGLSKAPRDERFSANVRLLTRGLGRAPGRDHRLRAGALRGRRGAAAGDRPPVPARAVAPDPRALPDRLRRGARRAADVQDRAHPDRRADAADVRAARPGGDRRPPCARPGTSSRTSRRSRSSCASRRPSRPGSSRRRWHPTQTVETEADGSLLWRATVSGTIEIRLWILSWGDDVEVLAPAALRDDVAATHRRAAERYAADRMIRRQPFAAVNLISDPIHGYIELTKRLEPRRVGGGRAARRGGRRGGPARHRLAPAAAADQPAPERALGLPDRRALALHARARGHARSRPVGALPLPEPAQRPDGGRRTAPVGGPRRRDAADGRAPP